MHIVVTNVIIVIVCIFVPMNDKWNFSHNDNLCSEFFLEWGWQIWEILYIMLWIKWCHVLWLWCRQEM